MYMTVLSARRLPMVLGGALDDNLPHLDLEQRRVLAEALGLSGGARISDIVAELERLAGRALPGPPVQTDPRAEPERRGLDVIAETLELEPNASLATIVEAIRSLQTRPQRRIGGGLPSDKAGDGRDKLAGGETTGKGGSVEATWRSAYRSSQALQVEFGSEGDYVEYVRAEQAGLVNILRGERNRTAASGPDTEEGCRVAYRRSGDLQVEFGDEDAYVEFQRAAHAGQVNILQRTAAHRPETEEAWRAEYRGSRELQTAFGDERAYLFFRRGQQAGAEAAAGRAAPQTDAGYRAEYERSPGLQAEFGDRETYISFRRAEAAGLVRIVCRS
jgi:hypothetical protein